MHRLAPVLLLVAALLLATSLGAPAAPTRVSAPFAPVEFLDAQASSVLNEVNVEVEQLRQRLATPVEAPVPERDPFNFGGRSAPDATVPIEIIAPIAPPAPLVLPRLVGIATTGDNGAMSRRAFVAYDDRVREVAAGDTLGPFTVRVVNAQGVELFHGERGTSHVIAIR